MRLRMASMGLVILTMITLPGWASKAQPNVLLFYMDDLRVNSDGTEFTPAQASLGSSGVVFKNAHTHYPMCGPSRNALLSGNRPETSQLFENNECNVRTNNALGNAVVTLPQSFRDSGYTTISLGKIFHPGCGTDNNYSWSEPAWTVPFDKPKEHVWLAVNSSVDEYNTTYLPDGMLGVKANATLEILEAAEKPFFLGVGLHRPHLPFIFPERFLDLYPAESVPLASNPYPPKDAPTCAEFTYGTMRNNFADMKAMCDETQQCDVYKGPIPDQWAKDLRRAYHAATSWTDSIVSGVMAKLEELKLFDLTVVAFVADHGWKLGEHASWEKQTLWANDMLTPFIISAPGYRSPDDSRSSRTVNALVEHIDLAPTLAQLCGIVAPGVWEGVSLVPLLNGTTVDTKNATFGQVTHTKRMSELPSNLNDHEVMGVSIRTQDGMKYNEWPKYSIDESGCKSRDYNTLGGRELYNLTQDPDENTNIVNQSNASSLVATLSARLRARFPASLPCPPSPSPSPSSLPCLKDASKLCGRFASNYTACHGCCWNKSNQQIFKKDGCDWKRDHSKVVKFVCGKEPDRKSVV